MKVKQINYNILDGTTTVEYIDAPEVIIHKDVVIPTEKERIEALEQAILVLMGGSDV